MSGRSSFREPSQWSSTFWRYSESSVPQSSSTFLLMAPSCTGEWELERRIQNHEANSHERSHAAELYQERTFITLPAQCDMLVGLTTWGNKGLNISPNEGLNPNQLFAGLTHQTTVFLTFTFFWWSSISWFTDYLKLANQKLTLHFFMRRSECFLIFIKNDRLLLVPTFSAGAPVIELWDSHSRLACPSPG